MNFNDYIRNIPDFPKEGILFKDITPLLKDKKAFKAAIDQMAKEYEDVDIDYVVGIEARGFIIGTPMAYALNKGFIPVRKPGKLPYDKLTASYDLEYGSNELEIHSDAIEEGDNILLVDDLLATGGTTKASVDLIEELGGNIVSIAFLLELIDLNGREKIEEYDIFTLLQH
ncbi:MAG TPA: adenine phosphoribosyltransferase [Halanaerobiales bacterium]|nr:adenine phosphoribosyltransferase [Halanaerobiales bacterium]